MSAHADVEAHVAVVDERIVCEHSGIGVETDKMCGVVDVHTKVVCARTLRVECVVAVIVNASETDCDVVIVADVAEDVKLASD